MRGSGIQLRGHGANVPITKAKRWTFRDAGLPKAWLDRWAIPGGQYPALEEVFSKHMYICHISPGIGLRGLELFGAQTLRRRLYAEKKEGVRRIT